MAQVSIPVRYEKHDGGGSVWVLVQGENNEYWLCVSSTVPRHVGMVIIIELRLDWSATLGLMERSEAGPSIPVPDWD